MTTDLTGTLLGSFRIERRLGAGGMGVVYEAVDTQLLRRVAVKVLSDDILGSAEHRRRFLREARTSAALSHPNIATVHQVGEAGEYAFLVMELVRGETLASRLRRGRVPFADALAIGQGLARALAHAHAAGVVHRDLKPENVMLDDVGHLKVLDFGIAKRTRTGDDAPASLPLRPDAVTAAGAILGTPGYMSPEQAMGHPVDHRSDLFSFGVILYELFSGRPPFVGRSPMEMLVATTRDEPPAPSSLAPGLPAGLDELLLACLQKAPERRLSSAVEALEWLARFDAPSAATPSAAGATTPSAAGARTPSARTPSAAGATTPSAATPSDLGSGATWSAAGVGPLSPTIPVVAGTPIPAQLHPSDRPPAEASDARRFTTTQASALGPRPTDPAPSPATEPRAAWRRATGLAVLGAAALGGLVAWRALVDDGASSSGVSGSASPSASAAPLREPRVGLDALALYADPRDSAASSLASRSLWDTAAEDFRLASEQAAAPPRWSAAVPFCVGQSELLTGKLEAAMEHFRAAQRLEPGWALPHVALSTALIRAQRPAEALAEARRAEIAEPASWLATVSIARAHSAADELSDAIQEYRRAVRKAPDAPELLAELALAYHAARMDQEAGEQAVAALARDPDLVRARLLLAERALEAGDATTALDHAARAVAVSPHHVAALLAEGDALLALGRVDEAKTKLAEAVRLWRETRQTGAPKVRLEAVEAALAAGRAPPLRGQEGPATSASTPPAARSRAPVGAGGRVKPAPSDPLAP